MVQDARGRVLGTISRNFTNFAREIFTDTGQYVVNFGANTTMQQRAVIFGTAISIDVDYFSRHSEHHGGAGFMFMPWATSGGQDEN